MWGLHEQEEFETGSGPAPAQLPLTTARQEITQRRHRTSKLCTVPPAQRDRELWRMRRMEQGPTGLLPDNKGLVPSGNSLYQVYQTFTSGDEPQHIPGVPLCFEPVTGGTLGASDLSTGVPVKPGLITVGTLPSGKGNFKESRVNVHERVGQQ